MRNADRESSWGEIERRTPAPKPHPSRYVFGREETATLWWTSRLLLLFLLVVCSVKGHDWWQAHQKRLATPTVSGATRTERALPSTAVQAPSRRVSVIQPLEASPTTRVLKCTDRGRVTYTEPGNCLGEAMATVRVEKSQSEALSEGLSDYQLEMLRAADHRIASDLAAAQVDMSRRQRPSSQQIECLGLAEQIRHLDEATRRPLTGYQHDTHRQERMKLTSRQAALRC